MTDMLSKDATLSQARLFVPDALSAAGLFLPLHPALDPSATVMAGIKYGIWRSDWNPRNDEYDWIRTLR